MLPSALCTKFNIDKEKLLVAYIFLDSRASVRGLFGESREEKCNDRLARLAESTTHVMINM